MRDVWRITALFGRDQKIHSASLLSLTLLVAAAAHSQEWLYTVRPGDNLWNVTPII